MVLFAKQFKLITKLIRKIKNLALFCTVDWLAMPESLKSVNKAVKRSIGYAEDEEMKDICYV